MVSGTPPRMNGNHSSMNAVSNRKAAKRTASTTKMRTHTTASLMRNERRADRASRASLMLESVEMATSHGSGALLLGQVDAVVPLLRELRQRPVLVHLPHYLAHLVDQRLRVGRRLLVYGDGEW